MTPVWKEESQFCGGTDLSELRYMVSPWRVYGDDGRQLDGEIREGDLQDRRASQNFVLRLIRQHPMNVR